MDLFQLMAFDCTEYYPIISFIKHGVIPIFQIGIPIILIVMGTIDLGKAVLSSDDKEIKAGTGRLIKRAIAAIFVFFITTIVTLVMGLFGKGDHHVGEGDIDNSTDTTSWSECWKSA